EDAARGDVGRLQRVGGAHQHDVLEAEAVLVARPARGRDEACAHQPGDDLARDAQHLLQLAQRVGSVVRRPRSSHLRARARAGAGAATAGSSTAFAAARRTPLRSFAPTATTSAGGSATAAAAALPFALPAGARPRLARSASIRSITWAPPSGCASSGATM